MKTPTSTQGSLLQDLKALPGEYWMLFSGTLINRFGHFVIPFLAIYLKQRGYGVSEIGITIGAYGAGGLIAGLTGGYLADRIGRKPTMLLSCGGTALFMLALSQATSIAAITILTFATGLMAAMYTPAVGALIADLIPQELRVRAYSCQRLAVNLGFAMGMATAGFMAAKSFALLFILDALTTLVLGVFLLVGIRNRSARTRDPAMNGWAPALRHMKGNKAFHLSVGASFIVAVVFWQLSSTYGLQITERAGLGEKTYGLLMAVNGVMITLLELPLTSVTRRFNPALVMAAGYALMGVGMGINAMGATLALLAASMIILTTGEMIALPVNNSFMASLAPDNMRGRYQGVVSISWSLAVMVGPSFGMTIYKWSPELLWIVIMALSFSAAGLMLATRRVMSSAQGNEPAKVYTATQAAQ